jgi:hypothetical protein
MITVPELAAEALGSFLTTHMGRRFGSAHANLIEALQSAARLALECIGNSDALYHNVEHTMLVTLVGYDIMKGRSLLVSTSASDYAHLIAASSFMTSVSCAAFSREMAKTVTSSMRSEAR